MRLSIRATAAALAVASSTAAAQSFPARPVVLIVPFAAGGPSDALARVLGQSMGAHLKQTIAVENITGAGGTVAAARAAQAKPDGHTMLLAHIGQATSATLYRKLAYDPVDSFETIGLIAEVPMTIVGRKDLPQKDVRELVSYVRANKGKVSYANGGIGSASHLCGLLFMSAMQAEMQTISYRGSGPALVDVLGGRIDLLCDQTTTTATHIKSGAIKGYAVTMKARVPSLPELPTLHESGLRDFELGIWYGLVAPKGTPKAAIDTLASALKASLSDPAFLKRLDEFGAQPITGERAGPAAFAKYFRAEVAKWRPIIQAAGVYAD
ncbi:MAG TPA: tripartite tricarboxylate transporter substrate-binding protein [Burkholderiales bacterium]|nr:tripartite tricarboxylate transporter substrate-binding protein [Burkholderiales bacterium]